MDSQDRPLPPICTMTVHIPSEPKMVHMVEAFIDQVRKEIDIQDKVLDNVMISITEAVNNGIIHGNRADPEKFVHVTFNCYPDMLEFIVQDEGPGFNPSEIPDPFHEDNLLKEGGRGVLIINHMMEDVRYEHTPRGMRITMRIHR